MEIIRIREGEERTEQKYIYIYMAEKLPKLMTDTKP